ncbi:hypothetical protein EOA50_30490 [Mesorhizobium sp. M1A.F.Ca.IN.020.30.1.1]|nr:hypothetical protein EOA50_30490 [Mesorhizobium sp. M1A.F.Ca.IN.020.30.1.1]
MHLAGDARPNGSILLDHARLRLRSLTESGSAPRLDRCIRVSVGLDHELDIFAEELPGALATARGN